MNRKVASSKTAISGLIQNTIRIILGFVSQRIFVHALGLDYAGVNGVFSNVISILTLSDLGVSTAVIYHLYKPIADGDHSKIAVLLNYYHRACQIIGGIILIGGLALLPFAEVFVTDANVTVNLYAVFGLFVINAISSYAFNYKRALVTADQKGYIVNRAISISSLVLYISKILIIIYTKNFYAFVICTAVAKLIENALINIYVNKHYPFLNNKTSKLEKSVRTDIKKKMYGSIYHNASMYVVTSTDSILISRICDITQAGLYMNYSLVLSSLGTLFSQIFGSLTASLGNVLAKEGHEGLYAITKKNIFANFWACSVVSIATYFCITPFVKLWLGDGYLLTDLTVIALIFNFYVNGVRAPSDSVLSAAGIIYEDRFVPIAEALINLGASIILGLWLGMPGIFIGTILSNLYLHFYKFSKYAYKLVLKRSIWEYPLTFLKYLSVFLVNWVFVGWVLSFVQVSNNFAAFIIRGAISVVLPSIIYWIIFHRSEEYRYFQQIFRKLARRIKR